MRDIIFEVSVTLPASASKVALEYMTKKHIPEVLKHRAFINANFFIVSESEPNSFAYTTHYYCRSHKLLADYQSDYATKMRQDFAAHLGQFAPKMTRRVLELEHAALQGDIDPDL